MTRSDLLELVYWFYPRGLHTFGLGYDDTEESHRRRDAARRAVAEYPTWKALLGRLRPRYRLQDESLHVLSGGLAPAYSGHLLTAGRRLGFHVCFLGPYYGIRRTGASGEEPAASELAQEIEAVYRGYEPIPPELGNEVVPEVSLDARHFGKATIYDCLLSMEWEWCSRPWPP